MQVNYETYKEMNFNCSKCGWQGKGDELVPGDFSEEHLIANLECPKCYNLIAFWQAPLTNKSDEDSP